MNDYKRRIDLLKMEESKQRSIESVLQTIQPKEKRFPLFTKSRTMILSFVLVIALIVVMNPFGESIITPPGPSPVTVEAYEAKTIAEISFLTTSLISSSATVSTMDTMYLSANPFLSETTTEFEDNEELINIYFDTLKIFLEDDVFHNNVTYSLIDGEKNTYLISFIVLDNEYELMIQLIDNEFTGTLDVNGTLFNVTGKIEESEEEFSIEIEAISGDEYIKIKHQTENKEDETESKYEVSQKVNNVEYQKEIKVSKEEDEEKVEITEGENSYELKKEFEDGSFTYKLQYKINGTEGEAIIEEIIDAQGNLTYRYSISEAGQQKEIEKGRPDTIPSNGNNQDDEDDISDDSDDTGKPENPGSSNRQNYDKHHITIEQSL